VAATALLVDRHRRDDTGYLALLACANDVETFERLVGAALEQAAMQGCHRLWGPVGLSPHLGAGMLESHFHLLPPLHSPYNPPYLPEVAASIMEPIVEGVIYRLPVGESVAVEGPAQLVAATAAQLAGDLLPLLAAASTWGDLFPRPDAAEAAFLAHWLGVWPLQVWTAEAEGEPVGLLVLQPDVGARVARARGGRNPLWRGWLGWQARRRVRTGRLLWLGVLPTQRGRGIGQQLWAHAVTLAAQAGWHEMTLGPLPAAHPGGTFLARQGGVTAQRVTIYETEL
jgi:GNAT superfamily N-acetyltransferase